jgi:hypothetical protein
MQRALVVCVLDEIMVEQQEEVATDETMIEQQDISSA